jgi:hypothetical protein
MADCAIAVRNRLGTKDPDLVFRHGGRETID